jgi:tetratricopeptide (TPR) repeat protein
MVTNLVPRDGADDDFGKDLAKALRELINDFARHQAIEEKEIKEAAKRYKVKMEDLNCVRSLQMIAQEVARITFCGSYTENRDDKTFTLQGVRFAAAGTAALEITDKTWHKDDFRTAAQEIAASFDAFVTQLGNAQFCGDYYEMENWTDAEAKCLIALQISPNDAQVRLIYAQLLRRTDRNDQAYEEVLKVIELVPGDKTALQLAGFLAAKLDLPDEAGEHFRQLLQLDPGNVPVRLKIAYELAQGGEPEVALTLAEEGLELDPDHVELLLRHASFAIRAGLDRQVANQPITLEAAEFFQKGVESYQKAYEKQGSEMDSAHLYRMIAALNALGRLDQALELAEQVLETHGDEARLWAVKGDILEKLDRVDEALVALEEAEVRDPTYPNIKVKQGQWLLESGREEGALPLLMAAVERGEQPADVIANMFFRVAVNKGIQPKDGPRDLAFALRMIGMAMSFESELSRTVLGRLDFYKAYSIYLLAVEQNAPENVKSAQLTLPRFKEVQRLLALPHVADWVSGSQAATKKSYQDMRDNVVQYIEIQEALIRRGS